MSLKVIEGLKPELVWKNFYDISQVPRPSKSEEKVRAFLRKFAEENKLEMKEDAVGNIVMKVPATKGYENAPVIVLQGHVDMVCEKNKGTEHDFEIDPIKLVKDGDWIKADGTTLGADNGIGSAAALAIAQDKSAVHGPLELLFTVDEETGLTGANNLQPGFIEGKTLLNLDSEEDGTFYVGCAGGQDSAGIFEIQFEDIRNGFKPYNLLIGGLKGGHSGMNIPDGRANAIKILGRLLLKLEKFDHQIALITGGSKRNAIPREAEAVVLINPDSLKGIEKFIDEFIKEILAEYKTNDGGLKISLFPLETPVEKAYSKKFVRTITDVINAMPHGVIAFSPDIEGLVETSTNLATITLKGKKLVIGTSQRSSIETAKNAIANSVKAVFDLAGAATEVGDGYPGWKPDMNSKVLALSKSVYQKLFGEIPEIKAVHAGLECGILGDKYPGLDMISLGPIIEGAHSPDERVNIPNVAKFYGLLKGILAELVK